MQNIISEQHCWPSLELLNDNAKINPFEINHDACFHANLIKFILQRQQFSANKRRIEIFCLTKAEKHFKRIHDMRVQSYGQEILKPTCGQSGA